MLAFSIIRAMSKPDVRNQLKILEPVRQVALMMEAASISQTSVNFYQTTWRSNPEDSYLH
jgi:hypothetical protein